MRKVFLDDLPKWGCSGRGKIGTVNWFESIGCSVKFIYDNISGEFNIIDYDSKKQSLQITYNNIEHFIRTGHLKRSKISVILGLHSKKNKYNYNINEVISTKYGDLLLIDYTSIEYGKKMSNKKHTFKAYVYKCLKCGNIDKMTEYWLSKGSCCGVCSNQKTLIGVNDIWTTNPNLAKLLMNPEDGYNYSQGSDKRVDWICQSCNNIVHNKKIYNINYNGLACPKCGDGISYPEKFVYNLLSQIFNNNFTWQLSKHHFDWCDNYKYDFYFKYNNEDYIIEVHGLQHYEKSFKGVKLQNIQNNDKLKELLAKNNVKHYIVIDAKESDLKYIKNSILYSELANLIDLTTIKWDVCHEFACKSLVKEVCDLYNSGAYSTIQIGKLLKLSTNTIIKYLRQGNEIKLCNYNAELNWKHSNKKIICLTTNKIFDSITEASKFYKISTSSISSCCIGKKSKSAGKSNNGERLIWKYYDDYLKEGSPMVLYKNNNYKKVICTNTLQVFDSLSHAGRTINRNASNILSCIQGKTKSCGNNLDSKEPLKWMYYEDYIKQQNNIEASA